jgi:hypothetical protein
VNEIHHGLRLREIHFAVQEGALGEFPRLRGPRSAGQHAFQHTLRHEHTAVTLKLDGVLARVARRTLKMQQHAGIEPRAVFIQHLHQMGATRHQLRGQLEGLRGEGERLRAGEADHGDRGLARSRWRWRRWYRQAWKEALPIESRPRASQAALSKSPPDLDFKNLGRLTFLTLRPPPHHRPMPLRILREMLHTPVMDILHHLKRSQGMTAGELAERHEDELHGREAALR